MVKKGFGEYVALMGVVITLIFLFTSASVVLPWPGKMIEKVIIQSDLYVMENALEAAKLYLETAFRYSVYQAVYDNARRGGWYKIPPDRQTDDGAYWYNNVELHGDVSPSEKEFTENLQNSAKDKLNVYRSQEYSFLTDYKVSLPEYNSVEVEDKDENKMIIHADSDGNLLIDKKKVVEKEDIKLEKNSSLNETFEIRYYKLFKLGKDFIGYDGTHDIDKVQMDVLEPWPKSGSLTKTACGSCPIITDEEVFIATTGKTFAEAIEDIKTEIKNDIIAHESELNSGYPTSKIKWEIKILKGPNAVITPACSSSCVTGGCCAWCGDPPSCCAWWQIETRTCTFTYTATVRVKLTITDEIKKLPVYNGTANSFEYIRLIFFEFVKTIW